MTNKIFSRMLAVAFGSSIVTLLLLSAVVLINYGTDAVVRMFGRYGYMLVLLIILITVIALLSAYGAAKKIVKPIEKMGDDPHSLSCPYEELQPFTDKIKRQLDEKDRLEHLTKQFTANLSHELKTPLTAISGYGEILQSGLADGQDAEKIGGIIYKESQRLINLTHDIIQLSQLEEYDFKPIIDSADITAVAKDCADALFVEAQKRGITISVEGESAVVRGSKTLLDELVYNLVDNAIRYNVENGSVEVSVKDSGECCVLTVKDTGIGIPEKYQSRIFERFFRVDKSRSKATGGTGLGLAIVKHTVEYLGGTLKLESEENAGTTITIELPKR